MKAENKSRNNAREAVGYRNPPKATRFKKGVSGNPQGRPKGRLNVATVFIRALHEKVVVNERGKKRVVTKLQAALTQMVNKAASGESRALGQLLELTRVVETRQDTAGNQARALNELDREVIQGIVERFESDESSNSDKKEEATDAKRR